MAKKQPEISIAAIRARAKAKGLKPTASAIRATYNRDVARRRGRPGLSTAPNMPAKSRGKAYGKATAPGQLKKPIGSATPAQPTGPAKQPDGGFRKYPGPKPKPLPTPVTSRKTSGGVRARPQGGDGTPAPSIIPKGGGLPLRGPGKQPAGGATPWAGAGMTGVIRKKTIK